MAVRPRMLALAAAEADGVALSMGSTPAVLRESVERVEATLRYAGRPRQDFRIGATCMVAVGRDLDAARNVVRGVVSLAERGMAEYLARDVLAPGALAHEGAAAARCTFRRLIFAQASRLISRSPIPTGGSAPHRRSRSRWLGGRPRRAWVGTRRTPKAPTDSAPG